MLSLFNRKELITTFSMEEQSRIRTLLSKNNIEYKIKTVSRNNPSPFSSGTRGRNGGYGEKVEYSYEYIIYVFKDDFEKAFHLIK